MCYVGKLREDMKEKMSQKTDCITLLDTPYPPIVYYIVYLFIRFLSQPALPCKLLVILLKRAMCYKHCAHIPMPLAKYSRHK